jgi:hypothetical protein
MKNRWLFLLLFALVPLVVGCQQTTTRYLGATAAREDVVRLSTLQGEQQRWQDTYVTIDYTVKQQGGKLALDGTFAFSFSPQINYTQVLDFKVKFFLLDKDLKVVAYQEIVRTLSTHLEDTAPFSYTFDLPENVVALTFGYEGYFRDSDEGGGGGSVVKYPKINP